MKQKNAYAVSLLVAVLLAFTGLSQTTFTKIAPQHELEYISFPVQGEQPLFRKITEDRDGNLWIATNKGMMMWDGIQFITYSPANPRYASPFLDDPGPQANSEKDGSLYVYNKGLIQFNTQTRITRKLAEPLASGEQQVRNWTYVNSRNEVILSSYIPAEFMTVIYKLTENRLVPVIRKKTMSRPLMEVLQDKVVLLVKDSLCVYNSGGGLLQCVATPAEFELISLPDDRPDRLLFIDKNTRDYYEFDIAAGRFQKVASLFSIANFRVTGLSGKDSLLCISGSTRLQLVHLNEGVYEDLSDDLYKLLKQYCPQNLSTNGARVIFTPRGAIYVMTENVLMRLKPRQPDPEIYHETVLDRDHRISLSFRGLAEDESHSVYASYYTGIARQTGGKGVFNWLPIPLVKDLKDDGVYGLVYDQHKLYWNNTALQLPSLAGRFLAGDKYAGHTTLLKDHDSLWIYVWNSRNLYATDLRTGITSLAASFTGQPYTNISDMATDEDRGCLWICSDYFIAKTDKKGHVLRSWTKEELKENFGQVNCMYAQQNLIWFGTNSGLGVLDKKSYQVSVFKNPVVSENGHVKELAVFSLLPYRDSLLLLGTNSGIVQFNLHNRSYSFLPAGHPLSLPEFNRNSVLKASNGKYYFGSVDGLYSFYPDQLVFRKTGLVNRPVHLVSISRYNQSDKQTVYTWENTDSIRYIDLSPDEANLELVFSIPSFDRPVFYSYRIKNYNEQWSEYSAVNKITISSLPPGNYAVEVKVSPSLNDQDAVFYSVDLHVLQVWYRRWWAIALLFAFAAGIFYLFIRRRVRKRLALQQQKLERQKELETLRTKISSDLHDDVGSILSGLAMQSQNLAMLANEKTREELNEIVEMSKEAMDRMRDTVWAIDSRKDKYVNLVDRMRAFAEQQLGHAGMEHEFKAELDDGQAFIDPVTRQNIYLIFKELMTNAAKHSGANFVRIVFSKNKDDINLLVHDNGQQQTQKNTDGMGKSNMQMRAAAMKASLVLSYDNGYKAELHLNTV